MIVAIDATPLTISSGGVRRYTQELTRALRREFEQDVFHFVSDQLEPVGFLDRRWWTLGVQRAMRRLNCDVFHGTDFAVPYLPLRPSVLSLHDLSPWMNPGWHHNADRVRRRTPYLIKLGIATMVLTDTEAVRRQAIEHFGISPSRIAAVPLAASSEWQPVQTAPPDKPYFLFVGTLEPRKNVPALVSAWRSMPSRAAVDLVIGGRRREDGPVIQPEPGLRLLGEVADSELPALYSNAVACVYPTLYEGFGLPVLEAMQCGCPVITSTDPAVVEVAGGAAIHSSPEELGRVMDELCTNPGAQQRLRERSRARAAEFSWASTARQTREVYAEAIRRFHG